MYSFLPYYLDPGRAFPPAHVFFEVTYRCNLRCDMCHFLEIIEDTENNKTYKKELSTEQIKHAIRSLPRSTLITFTGGVRVGKLIAEKAGYRRAALELGGNDPAIVMADVDAKAIAPQLFWAAFQNNAQFCNVTKRLYIHEDVYDEVRDALAERLRLHELGIHMMRKEITGMAGMDHEVGLRDRAPEPALEHVADVEVLVAGEEAPELDAVDDFQSGLVAVPLVVGAEDAGYLWIAQVFRIPQPQLSRRGVESELEHVAALVGAVGLGAVPDAVMGDHDRPRLTDHGKLTPEILVAADVGLADAAKMATRKNHRATHLPGRLVGEVEELDVEVLADVDDGVGVPDLPLLLVGLYNVYGVVVVDRIRTDEAVHYCSDKGKPEHLADRTVCPQCVKGCSSPFAGNVGFHLLAHRMVEVVRNNVVPTQEPVGSESGHFF